jgi:murein DD-endopeptidase MepM/ murein hydrolase activator NlpD
MQPKTLPRAQIVCYIENRGFQMNPEDQPNMQNSGETNPEIGSTELKPSRGWSQTWERIVRMGLGETAVRVGTGLAFIALVLLVVWVMANFYLKAKNNPTGTQAALAASAPTSTPSEVQPTFAVPDPVKLVSGITRQAKLHTSIPDRPRAEIVTYTVQTGDNLYKIAEMYNLTPSTILWGNYATLADDPHRLKPGQKLNILPENGVLYDWHAGDGLNGVAKYFGVKPETILNYSLNDLNVDEIGDFANPNIEPGTLLIIPGGHREFINWSAPRISRFNPGVAKILGPGACSVASDGPVGLGTFIWPAVAKTLSGYDYSPETNHYGIDIAGRLGDSLFATDNGVIVYAGWNDWGYGNVVVIDHGNGWQSLYAHLSALNVACGSFVYQGMTIGFMGSTGNSTGPHLHFEMMSEQFGRPNPWNFLKK